MKKIFFAMIALISLSLTSAYAANKGYDQKVVVDNDRVRVMIVTWKPGAESPSVARELDRVVYAVKGGSIVRKYEDGRKVKYSYKAGDTVFANSPDDKQPYSIKNIGKSTLVLQATFLK